MNYINLLKNKGHQRLWLVASLCWIAGAGYLFWEPLPERQAVDVSQEASDLCKGEARTKAEALGEKAYQACNRKSENDSEPAMEGLPGITTNLTKESICNVQRSAAVAAILAKEDANEFDCLLLKAEKLGHAQQPEADRLTDNLRIEKLSHWAMITLVPPIVLPFSVVFLLYSVVATGKWISAGYKDKQ